MDRLETLTHLTIYDCNVHLYSSMDRLETLIKDCKKILLWGFIFQYG